MLRSDSDSRARLEYFLPSSPKPCTVYIESTPFTIGRTEDADLPLESTSVSREHAHIEKTATGYRIVDLGSTNGTEVNGKPVTDQVILDGDALRIADVDITFCSSAMGRLQRIVTRPINAAASHRRERAVDTDGISARRRNEALLWQLVPVDWQSVVDIDNQQPVAHLPTIGPIAAMGQGDAAYAISYSHYQLLRSSWHVVAQQRESVSGSATIYLPVQWCDSTERRLMSDLFDAASSLPHDSEWGVALSWEFFELAAHRPNKLNELQQNGVPLSINSFTGVAADLQATAAFVPKLVVLCRSFVEGVSTNPRRMEQLAKLAEYCQATGIQLALPAGLSQLAEDQCQLIGIRLQGCDATSGGVEVARSPKALSVV